MFSDNNVASFWPQSYTNRRDILRSIDPSIASTCGN